MFVNKQNHTSLLVPFRTKGCSDTTALEHVERLLRVQTTNSLIHGRTFLVRWLVSTGELLLRPPSY